jgi:predicted metal-dependent hydrolase
MLPEDAHALMITAAGVGDVKMLHNLMTEHQLDMSQVLAWASHEGQHEVVSYMLDHGVGPSAAAMYNACLCGHAFVVSVLVQYGGKMTQLDVETAWRKGNHAVVALCDAAQPGWQWLLNAQNAP